MSVGLLSAAIVAALSLGQPLEPQTRELLPEREWGRLDRAVDRGLQFLISQQRPNGSFAAPDLGQPGITGLCVMAFLSRGHMPDEGPFGQPLAQAVDYVLSTQRESGLLFHLPVGKDWVYGKPSHTGIYNHAIAGLMLSEVYGMTGPATEARLAPAIRSAVEFTLDQQLRKKRNAIDRGGWRYLGSTASMRSDSDLSITSWQLQFLRSARNAEFEVPREPIDEAMAYVRRSFEPSRGAFTYGRLPPGNHSTRAIVGSGVLSLSLGGEHRSDIARQAGDWILQHPFDDYNRVEYHEERYHYSAYYCSVAMFQLGGDHWAQFFPRLQRVLLKHQEADGSWPAESNRDGHFGNAYTTALAILSLTPPYQLLPIYQR